MLKQYCLHFSTFKCTKSLFIPAHPECKNCSANKTNLWLCLTRDCQEFYCGRRQYEHLAIHYQESRKKKSYHSLFMNVLTAQIYCVSCKLFVGDEQDPPSSKELPEKSEQTVSKQNSAFRLRTKVLPFLSELGSFKFDGQIEYPEAHRKINSCNVGVVSDRYNHTIHSALQFFAHCAYFKDIVLAMSAPENNQLLREFQVVVEQINSARHRVITAEKLDKLVYSQLPHLLAYRRKDPFELILFFLAKLHERLRYKTLIGDLNNQDEWDAYYDRRNTRINCPLYDSIEIHLRMNYYCSKCKKHQHAIQNINYLKLTLPKKKRNNREVEKELKEFRGESPIKQRKNSLVNFLFKEPDMPITIHQMIIDLMKKPIHKEKKCEGCSQNMKKSKIQIEKLPNYLIIQVNRMDTEGYAIDEAPVQCSHETIDMGAFTVQKEKEVLYVFECAVGVERGGFYPVMARNPNNKQLQLFKNQTIEYSQKINPYILCYKRQTYSKEKSHHINSNKENSLEHKESYIIPDFWMVQLKHGFQRQLINPFICKHSCLKPNISSLEINKLAVRRQVYEEWVESYNGKSYENYICFECEQNLFQIQQRKKLQKQTIKLYDSLKIDLYCMVSIEWVNRWSNFVYRRDSPNYLSKGWPLPGKIDNKVIMEDKQCKPYLVLNTDFKLVNVYVWKFLRQLYGGGPEIRYKWKKQHSVVLDQKLLFQIKENASKMRQIVRQFTLESPIKKSSTMEQSSYLPQQQQSNLQI